MGIFGKNGIMNVIRCDAQNYLIWKWRPENVELGSSRRENSIRSGSAITIHAGQAAIFLSQQKEGEFDVIRGPYNGILSSENLPVITSIMGAGYNGDAPFQAEAYFVNLAKNLEIPFVVPYFTIVPDEPEYKPYTIRVAVKGTLVFEASTDKEMIKYLFEAWGGKDTSIEELKEQVKSLLIQEVKQNVANAAKDTGIFILHFNSFIGDIGQYIKNRIQEKIVQRFGVVVKDITISDIRYDEDSDSYIKLKRITEEQAHILNLENEKTALLGYQLKRESMQIDTAARNKTVIRTADIHLSHEEDMLSRMREEGQFAQHQQTLSTAKRSNLAAESDNLAAHQINVQGDVMSKGMENMGEMGGMDFGSGNGHLNPAGVVTGMMMGTSVAGQVSDMMNNLGNGINQKQPSSTPPPIPGTSPEKRYFVVLNGQQYGPYTISYLTQMIQEKTLNENTLVWCDGMSNWSAMKTVPSLSCLFENGACPPPIPEL